MLTDTPTVESATDIVATDALVELFGDSARVRIITALVLADRP